MSTRYLCLELIMLWWREHEHWSPGMWAWNPASAWSYWCLGADRKKKLFNSLFWMLKNVTKKTVPIESPWWSFTWHIVGTQKCYFRNSYFGTVETNLTSIHEDAGMIPGFSQWVKNMALPWAVLQTWLRSCFAVAVV